VTSGLKDIYQVISSFDMCTCFASAYRTRSLQFVKCLCGGRVFSELLLTSWSQKFSFHTTISM